MAQTLRFKKPKTVVKPTSKIDLFCEWAADTHVTNRGQPLELLPFQIDVLADHFADDPAGGPLFRTVAFSCGRKNGKSLLLSLLVAGYLDPASPCHAPYFQVAVTSPTSRHSEILPSQILELYDRIGRRSEWSFSKTPPPTFRHKEGRGLLTCLSGARSAGHGLDLDLALVDEAGLLSKSNETLTNITDALASKDGRAILTGTRGDSGDYNEILNQPDPRTSVHLHGVDKNANAADPAIWEQANPGLGISKSRRFMQDAFDKAQASGSLTEFRVWHLNMPLSPSRQLLLEYDTFSKAYDENATPIEGEPCFIGLDLGGSAAMTAAVILYRESGVLRCLGAFPSEGLDLAARGKRDGIGSAYVTAAERGELFETSGAVTDLAEFLARLRDEVGNHPVLSISADRYRDAEFRTAMARAQIDWPIVTRGTGPKDGDNDIRATRRLFLSGKAKLRRNLLLEAGLTEADVKVSTTGAMQLDKSHRNARIDVAQALCLACSAFITDHDRPQAEIEVTVL
ncbi:phage terminase [Antarctobacter heliothermus]|uniref:Phage terminase n=1 Tax=Antarctobacter heliothermus TaxID=74033 RepID=A0A222E766_9RHOB|nr:terminase TerL endonuclease subunit [Antarctobacter heliothermus]ASP22059.1 phage terminase [Antarctobacter heliothermus]